MVPGYNLTIKAVIEFPGDLNTQMGWEHCSLRVSIKQDNCVIIKLYL